MALVRLFIAVEIPFEVKSQISQVVSQLQAARADVRWEPPEKLHITLKFLGETPEEMLPQIVLLLVGIAGKTFPFPIRYSGLGCFPDMHDPRIIWVGVDDFENNVQPVVTSIETKMASIGFEKEIKEFHPHVTVGRIKSKKNLSSLLRTMQSITFESQPISITEIALVKSELRPEGSVHSQLKAFSFAGISAV